jgi:hypothetical protein
MLTEEERKERNRVCSLKYYHAHKQVKREVKPKPETLEEYIEQKRQYFKNYYQQKKLKEKEKN